MDRPPALPDPESPMSAICSIRSALLSIGLGRSSRPELRAAIALCERFRAQGEAAACAETIAAARGIAHHLDRHLEDRMPVRAQELSDLHRLLDHLARALRRPETP
jgi:hypothetical protein